MIKYNKDLDIKNRTKFSVSMLFSDVEMSKYNFNCVICECKISLDLSVSNRGAHLICRDCQHNKFKNYDEVTQFLEAVND